MAVKFLSISNKGGVGKSELSNNIAHSLASKGKRVLMVDTDSQGNLTELNLGMGSLDNLEFSLIDTLISFGDKKKKPVKDIIINIDENLDLVPCNIDLAAAETILNSEFAREFLLKRTITPVEDEYDIIIIDSSPSIGLLGVCAMTYADYLIIPFDSSFLAYRGVKLVEGTYSRIKEGLNPDLEIYGLICNMYSKNINHDREIRQAFIDEGYTLLATLGKSVKVKDSFYTGKPLVISSPKHPISREISKLTDKIIKDIEDGIIMDKKHR